MYYMKRISENIESIIKLLLFCKNEGWKNVETIEGKIEIEERTDNFKWNSRNTFTGRY